MQLRTILTTSDQPLSDDPNADVHSGVKVLRVDTYRHENHPSAGGPPFTLYARVVVVEEPVHPVQLFNNGEPIEGCVGTLTAEQIEIHNRQWEEDDKPYLWRRIDA